MLRQVAAGLRQPLMAAPSVARYYLAGGPAAVRRSVVGLAVRAARQLSVTPPRCASGNDRRNKDTRGSGSASSTSASSSSTFSTDFLDAMLPDATGPNLTDTSQAPVRRVLRKGQAIFDSKFERALARIKVSSNNTIVTITTLDGDPIVTKSAGMCGFKGARKSTTYAARVAAQQAGEVAVNKGVMTVSVLVKGLGAGRVNALKGLVESKLMVDQVADVTPVPHNGCRPKKARRL